LIIILDQNLFKVLEGILVLVQGLATDLDYQDLPMDEQYHYLYLYLYLRDHIRYLAAQPLTPAVVRIRVPAGMT